MCVCVCMCMCMCVCVFHCTAELGDYSSDDLHPDYVHEFEFVAGQVR